MLWELSKKEIRRSEDGALLGKLLMNQEEQASAF